MGELVGPVQIRPWGFKVCCWPAARGRPSSARGLSGICPDRGLGDVSAPPRCSPSGSGFPAFFPVSVWLIMSVSRLDWGSKGWPQPRWDKLCRPLRGHGPRPGRQTPPTGMGLHSRLSLPEHDLLHHEGFCLRKRTVYPVVNRCSHVSEARGRRGRIRLPGEVRVPGLCDSSPGNTTAFAETQRDCRKTQNSRVGYF